MIIGLDAFSTGIAGVCLLIVLVLLGVRVFAAAAVTGFLGLLELKGWHVAASIAGQIPHSKTVTYPLSVLPLFILIGFLAFYAGLTTRLFEAARRWMDWACWLIKGSLVSSESNIKGTAHISICRFGSPFMTSPTKSKMGDTHFRPFAFIHRRLSPD